MPNNPASPGFYGNISEDMPLGNIFEQIAHSQNYGWLFLKYPDKEVRLYFQGDLIGLVTPPEDKFQFIPEKLYYAGKLSQEDYERVISSEEPLKGLEEVVPEEEIATVLNNICYDEICSLFLNYEGYFEFTEQNHSEEVNPDLIPIGRMFESDGILIEATRRQQEYKEIYGSLPSPDEILICNDPDAANYPPDDPIGNLLTVANRRALREIKLFCYFGEFDAMRILSSMLQDAKIRPLNEEELRAYATEFETKEDWNRAIQYYQVLLQRNPLDNVACDALSTCYEKIGQQDKLPLLYQTTAISLLQSGKKNERTQGAFYLKKFCEISPESVEGIDGRVQLFDLAVQEKIDSKAIEYNVLLEGKQLFQTLRYRREDKKARQILEHLLRLAPQDKSLPSQYINVCLDLRDINSAVAQYENMAKIYERDHNWKEVEGVYQKIVKLCPSRVDIQQKLETMKKHRLRMPRLAKVAGWLVVLAALSGGGWWGYTNFVAPQDPNNKPHNGSSNIPDRQPQLAEIMREKQKKVDKDAGQLLLQAMEAKDEWDLVKSKSLLEESLYKGPSEFVQIFNGDAYHQIHLNNNSLPDPMRLSFEQNNCPLSQDINVTVKIPSEEWLLEDVGKKQKYQVVRHKTKNILVVSLVLKSEIQGLLETVKKQLDEFDQKLDQAKINEQNGEIEVARHIYLELWKDARYIKLPKRKNIRIPVSFDVSPAGVLIKVDGQENPRQNSPQTVYCSPVFKEIEISLPGYTPRFFFNSFVSPSTPPIVDEKRPLEALPDTKVVSVKLEKTTIWESEIEEDNKRRRALLVEGNLYYANGVLYIACRNDSIYAYQWNNEGGAPQRLWKLKIGRLSSFSTSPVLHKGILYIGGQNGVFYAIDADKGEIRQQSLLDNKPLINCSPVISTNNRMVFIAASDGAVYTFPLVDPTTKSWAPLWKFPTQKKIVCTPAAVDDLLLIGGTNKFLYALNVKTKAVTWYKSFSQPIAASPVIDGTTAYVGAGDQLFAYGYQDGKSLWNCKLQGNILSILATKENLLVVSDSPKLFAVSKKGERSWDSGEKGWGKDIGTLANAPVVSSRDTIYLSAQKTVRQGENTKKEGILYALASNGQLLWEYKIGAEIFASPVLLGNTLVLGADKLYAFLDN